MIVMASIAILASIAYISVTWHLARARDVTRISDLRFINQALAGYFTTHDAYPPTACGYDCLVIDPDSFITSAQSSWSSVPLASSSFFFPTIYAAPLGVGAFEIALAPFIWSRHLPRDPKNNATYPWVDNQSYAYSYGNVGSMAWQVWYDLTATLENPDNKYTCKQSLARYGYANNLLCDKNSSASDAVINPLFSGLYHSRLYEVGVRDNKYALILSASTINYSWVIGPWGGWTLPCWLDTETRSVLCYRSSDSVVVDYTLCGVVPATSQVVDRGICAVASTPNPPIASAPTGITSTNITWNYLPAATGSAPTYYNIMSGASIIYSGSLLSYTESGLTSCLTNRTVVACNDPGCSGPTDMSGSVATVVTTYLGCDTPDITIGTTVWSACNVGASQMSTSMNGTEPEIQRGKHFQWWENVAWTHSSGLTLADNCIWDRDTQSCGASAGLTSWPATVTDTQSGGVARWGDWSMTDNRGPCAAWYHVPTSSEFVASAIPDSISAKATLHLSLAGARSAGGLGTWRYKLSWLLFWLVEWQSKPIYSFLRYD